VHGLKVLQLSSNVNCHPILAISFSDRAHATKMKKMTFFQVNWILLFEHSWIFKNLTGYTRMAKSAVPKRMQIYSEDMCNFCIS